jgi:Nif-specific regulatory protein
LFKAKAEQELQELTCLYEIAKALNSALELKKSLYEVLDLLSRYLGMNRGAITIFNPLTSEIRTEVAHGLDPEAKNRGRYKPGEGITGRVVETAQPMVVPRISQEPLFLNRTGARSRMDKSDISFFCVPIKDNMQVVGTLSVDRPFSEAHSPEEDLRLLTIIATLIAQKVVILEKISVEKEQLERENLRLRNELGQKYRFSNIMGTSKEMQEVFRQINQVAKSQVTVLLRGESGTGKELVAHAIHYNSLKSQGPLIKVNCAAIPSTLAEAELFGYEKGAFTGAVRAKPGKFELAAEGTLFLDEVGSLNLEGQGKLLRVIQEKEMERLGGTRTIKLDVRLIAATNRNLEQAIEEGEFRPDLYYRLNVFPLFIPPLRERKTDLLLLSDYFLEKYRLEHGKDVRRISTPAIDMLMQYHWPGNVRELENCIERAVLVCEDKVIHSYHLPPTLQTAEETHTEPNLSMDDAVARFEQELLIDALKTTRGNMSKAARLLKTTDRKFCYKVLKYNVNPKQYR